jgi:3-oxoacyl-[acyl-carrier-protein] synthase-1
MSAHLIAIKATGLVTSVGLSAPASCAAMRAKVSNPTETRFIDSGGQWIMAQQVALEKPWRGLTKLTKMATMVIAECLDGIARDEWASMPLLLCVAEQERQGRLAGLDDQLFRDIEQALGVRFAPASAIIAQGRVSVAIALAQARKLIHEHNAPQVIIAAADSLLSWPTLGVLEREQRLLTERNSNGFMPGEGGGALLVGRPQGKDEMLCTGIGFGIETAHIDSGEPLRADGLTAAIKKALAEAGCEMHDMDFRITDLSGEQYYFKEAALALSRTLRKRKETFDLWHPAECIGECGSAAGLAVLALANAACRKAYALGPHLLIHLANDGGSRAATVLRYLEAQ